MTFLDEIANNTNIYNINGAIHYALKYGIIAPDDADFLEYTHLVSDNYLFQADLRTKFDTEKISFTRFIEDYPFTRGKTVFECFNINLSEQFERILEAFYEYVDFTDNYSMEFPNRIDVETIERDIQKLMNCHFIKYQSSTTEMAMSDVVSRLVQLEKEFYEMKRDYDAIKHFVKTLYKD